MSDLIDGCPPNAIVDIPLNKCAFCSFVDEWWHMVANHQVKNHLAFLEEFGWPIDAIIEGYKRG